MSVRRNVGVRLAAFVIGGATVLTIMGCPPPQQTATAGRPEVSQRFLDSLRADSAQKCRQHRSFAYNYARAGMRQDAITQFEKAFLYCEPDAEIERFYAQFLDQWNMRDSAFVHYRRSSELDTTNVRVNVWLYDWFYDKGEYRDAIIALHRAARFTEDTEQKAAWLKSTADMMSSEGMKDESCALYAELAKLQPDDGEIAQRMLACVGDNPEERLAILRTACMADTNNRAMCENYAAVALRAGQDSAALKVYKRIVRNQPDDVRAWEVVAQISDRVGEPATALAAVEKLMRLDPRNVNRVAAYADRLFAQDRVNEGGRVVVQALRDFPDDNHMLYLAGFYYARQGGDGKRTALGYLDRVIVANDPVWRSQALNLHDSIEPPLSSEEINQAKFFGRRVTRLHRCRIPGREAQNEVMAN